MHLIRTALCSTAILALAACTTLMEEGPPANPQSVVDQRVGLMKKFGAALGAAANHVQGKPTAAVARKAVADARAGLEPVTKLFPRGTALGDKGVIQSRALSIIFANRSDFEAKFDTLAGRLAALDAALAANDKAAVTKALADTRAACSACHNKYRAPED